MQLCFKEIKLHNFLSFEDAEINLDRRGYTLVSGVNSNPDDLAKSNGSGKSSIWEAISWCLTGETIRGTKEVKRLGADKKEECFVELNLLIDNNEYEIKRSKDPSNLIIICDGKDVSGKGIRDTEKILSDRLPDLTSSLLGSVVILGQGLPQRFTNNSPSGRKEVLEKLSKSDFMIFDIKDRISSRKNYLSESITNLKLDVSNLTGKKQVTENQLKDIESRIEDLKLLDGIESAIKSQEEIVSKLKSDVDTVTNRKSIVEASINNYKLEIRGVEAELSKVCNEIRQSKAKDIDNYKQFLYSSESEASSKLKEINKLKNIKDVCPTCGQKIPGVVKVDTSELEQEYNNLIESANAYRKALDDIETEIKENQEKTAVRYKERSDFFSSNIKTWESELNDINSNLSSINFNFSNEERKLIELKSKLESINSKQQDLENSKKNLTADLNEIDNKILYNNNEIENLESHLAVINKFNTLVTREFRGYLLSGIIDYISKRSKEYSEIVFKTDKIDFYLDGNNISISYDNKPYEALSGGEKQKVDLIVQFAMRDMLCKYLGFSSNIIVLDEIFDNLDSDGCQNVLNLISTRLTDVQNIFIVTHHTDIAVPADYELVVTKGPDKISRISSVI